MWLTILSLADKVFDVIGQLTGFWIRRSDASQKKRDKAQAEMQKAVKDGDLDAYWNARSRRNRS